MHARPDLARGADRLTTRDKSWVAAERNATKTAAVFAAGLAVRLLLCCGDQTDAPAASGQARNTLPALSR